MPAVSIIPSYAFLSKAPQNQKKRRPKPVPPVNVVFPFSVDSTIVLVTTPSPRRRSATLTSTVGAWTTAVQPGSPTRRSPIFRRGSVSSIRRYRRCSITHNRTNSSSSVLHLLHPSSPQKFTKDSASMAPSDDAPRKSVAKLPKRIRSLSVLRRPRARSITSGPPSPTKPKPAARIPDKPKSTSKSKVKTNLPPTLANEVLLLQFMDGGSLETNMKRVMKKQAQRAAKNAAGQGELAVADVHRDGKGGFWRDQDEEMEYAPLIPSGEDADDPVEFDTERFVVDRNRRLDDGFEDSFDPAPAASSSAVDLTKPGFLKKKKSRIDVRSLFGTN